MRPTLPIARRMIIDDLKGAAIQTGAGLIHFLDNALAPRLLAHLIDHPTGVTLVRVCPDHPATSPTRPLSMG
jgi:hypothetical protein